jgi:hypothetical protein
VNVLPVSCIECSPFSQEVHYSHLLLYAKIVPAKERLQVVARSYFNSIGALLQPAILVHTAVFSACAKAVFLSVNLSASLSTLSCSCVVALRVVALALHRMVHVSLPQATTPTLIGSSSKNSFARAETPMLQCFCRTAAVRMRSCTFHWPPLHY